MLSLSWRPAKPGTQSSKHVSGVQARPAVDTLTYQTAQLCVLRVLYQVSLRATHSVMPTEVGIHVFAARANEKRGCRGQAPT